MYCMRNPGKSPGFRGPYVDTLSRALESILSVKTNESRGARGRGQLFLPKTIAQAG